MVKGALDLLSTVAVVLVVGVAAIGLLVIDLIHRELGGPRNVAPHYRGFGVAMTVAFLALAILRFVMLGA
jgi:hypothetical protein